MSTNRRSFLVRSAATGLVSLGANSPLFLQRALHAAGPEAANDRDGTILVLVELAGGNDGLNTVVPFTDDAYHKARPGIGLGARQVLKLDDQLGLHPQMTGMKALYDEGSLAIMQGVGYPNPDRAHFRSMDIWHSARPGDEVFRGDGWLGRALDESGAPDGNLPALAVGTERLPRALLGHKVNVPLLRNIEDFQRQAGPGPERDRQRRSELLKELAAEPAESRPDLEFLRNTANTAALTARRLETVGKSYQPTTPYPENNLGKHLEMVAQLIAADLGTRIFFVSLGGFDTHSQQEGAHAALVTELSAALHAFRKDLEQHALAERVLLATFSEFGRRVEENGSLGTDHGTASQMFILPPAGRGKTGFLGDHPSLSDLDEEGDLHFHTDFRSVYATLLEKWLGFPSEPVLGAPFETLDFV